MDEETKKQALQMIYDWEASEGVADDLVERLFDLFRQAPFVGGSVIMEANPKIARQVIHIPEDFVDYTSTATFTGGSAVIEMTTGN